MGDPTFEVAEGEVIEKFKASRAKKLKKCFDKLSKKIARTVRLTDSAPLISF